MASLQNEQIDQSYQGLIKTANNTSAAPFPPVKLQYGDGTELPISIGDGTGIGIGDIVNLTSATRSINLDSANLSLTGVTFVNALSGTCNISDGTYEFGLPYPGAPTTNVDMTNAAEVSAHQIDIKGDGTDAGKLKLYCEDAGGAHNVTLEGPAHAGGATYSLKFPNVQSAGTQILEADSSGNLSWINTPSGGGGGAAQAFSAIGASAMKGVVPYNENAGQQFKTNQMLSGYGSTTAGQNNDAAMWQLVPLAEGNTISKLLVSVSGALAGGTAEVAFYDTDVDSDGFIYVKDRLLSLGTVDCSTTGDKIITLGTPFTMPSGKVNGQIAVLAFRSDNAIGMRGWSQTVFSGWGGSMQNTTYYRAMSPSVKPGVAPGVALPATIGDKSTANVTYGAQTSNPLMVMWI
jgi:hypothetical protein